MRKLYLVLLCGLLCISNLNAQTWNIGYPNAADVTATLQDSTLAISGTGAMVDWNQARNVPWDDWSVRSSIRTLIVESGVTTIGSNAFFNSTNLNSVTISNSVTSIGSSAFFRCTNLKNLIIEDGTSTLTLNGTGTNYAFYGCNPDTLHLGRNINWLGSRQFGTNIKYLTIGNNVTSIGDWAFFHCTALASVIIGNNVTTIGNFAFQDCTSLTSIIIPNSVTTIGDRAFFNCTALASVIIGNSVTTIGVQAFQDCTSLTSIIIPNSVTTIGDRAFFHCTALISVIIGNNVTTIGNSAFQDCTSLTSIIIPNSVTTIGDRAFFNCTALTSVIIGNSVTTIGVQAFMNCTNLTSVTSLNPVPPAVMTSAFLGVNRELCTLYVVSDKALAFYQNAEIWRDFLNIRALEPSNIDVVNATEIQIFPNPVTNELRIINHDWQQGDVVKLFDMNGRLVFSKGVSNTSAQGELIIDISSQKSGHYILHIGNRTAKVVKL